MEKDAKIYVAGHRGLVGSAIWKNLQQKGYTNLVDARMPSSTCSMEWRCANFSTPKSPTM